MLSEVELVAEELLKQWDLRSRNEVESVAKDTNVIFPNGHEFDLYVYIYIFLTIPLCLHEVLLMTHMPHLFQVFKLPLYRVRIVDATYILKNSFYCSIY